MVILRVISGVKKHFRIRVSEWALATATLLWGSILLGPSDTFGSSKAYTAMASLAGENIWGMGAVIIGGLRLTALLINGSFGETWYGTFSPHIRAICSFANCFLWFEIIIGLMGSNIIVLGFAIYPVMLFLDIWNVMQATTDAALTDKARRYGGVS
jgi:hypothetical protein